jgi:ABC-type protease/lipase transport system fused ATPase/permease subunit
VLRDGQAQMFGPRDDVLKALNDATAQARPAPAAPSAQAA